MQRGWPSFFVQPPKEACNRQEKQHLKRQPTNEVISMMHGEWSTHSYSIISSPGGATSW
jgi:hypothetical protein